VIDFLHMEWRPRTIHKAEWVAAGLVVCLALGLRLTYLAQIANWPVSAPATLDPAFYYDWARQIAAGSWMGTTPFVQSPLYAYLLAIFIKVFGDGVHHILLAQSLVGTGTVALTYLLTRRILGWERAVVAGLLVALYGPFIFHEGMVMKTFLSPFLTLILALLLDYQAEQAGRAGWGWFLLSGVAFGLTTLDRENFILLLPALLALSAFLGGGLKRAGWLAATAAGLGAALVITPVTLHNWEVSHEFVLLTTGGGEVFFIGNNADADGTYKPPAFIRADPRFEHGDFIARAAEITGRNLSPMQSSWFWFREGLRFVREHPLAWLRLLLLKTFHFWNYYELPDNLNYRILERLSPLLGTLNPTIPPVTCRTLAIPWGDRWLPVRLHLVSTLGTLAPLGFVGLLLTRRRWRRLLPIFVLLFGYMGTVLMFFNFDRFRVPVVPLVALFASEALFAIARYLGRIGALFRANTARSAGLVERLRSLRPSAGQWSMLGLSVGVMVVVNVDFPRGPLPVLEEALALGDIYNNHGDQQQALDSYAVGLLALDGLEDGPDDPRLNLYGARMTRERLGREIATLKEEHQRELRDVHVGLHHGTAVAFMGQAERLIAQDRRKVEAALLDSAIREFDEALRIFPTYTMSMRLEANAYRLQGDNDRAVATLRQIVSLYPEAVPVRLELAELLFAGGDARGALAALIPRIKEPTNIETRQWAQLLFLRAMIFDRGLSDPARALYDFEKVLELDPEHVQAPAIRERVKDLRAGGVRPSPDDPLGPDTPSHP